MKGILFKPDMIKAIVEDRKTQTRRVIKPQFELPQNVGKPYLSDGYLSIIPDVKEFKGWAWITDENGRKIKPRYQVGEVVYIKEAWEIEQIDYPMAEISYVADVYGHDDHDVYIADKKLPTNLDRIQTPLFMPAWAARTFIKITDVKAERLKLPLSPEEMALEGGELALPMLELIDGKWVFVYAFLREVKPLL